MKLGNKMCYVPWQLVLITHSKSWYAFSQGTNVLSRKWLKKHFTRDRTKPGNFGTAAFSFAVALALGSACLDWMPKLQVANTASVSCQKAQLRNISGWSDILAQRGAMSTNISSGSAGAKIRNFIQLAQLLHPCFNNLEAHTNVTHTHVIKFYATRRDFSTH